MIQDMFAVMGRIAELRNRFGLASKSRPVQIDKPGSDDQLFRQSVDRALSGAGNRSRIDDAVDRYSREYKIPASLIRSVIEVESNYNPQAVSPKGAKGLMQLMPAVIQDKNVSDPFSIEENIRGGTSLLRELLDRYNGDYKLALAAYNAGRTPVDRVQGVPEYPETRQYVKKVIQSYLDNQ